MALTVFGAALKVVVAREEGIVHDADVMEPMPTHLAPHLHHAPDTSVNAVYPRPGYCLLPSIDEDPAHRLSIPTFPSFPPSLPRVCARNSTQPSHHYHSQRAIHPAAAPASRYCID